MQKRTVTLPDGRKYTVNIPDGVNPSQDDIFEFVAQSHPDTLKPVDPERPSEANVRVPKYAVPQFLEGAGNAIFDQMRGSGQLLGDVLPTKMAKSLRLPNENDVSMARKKTAPLYATTGGSAGELFGRIIPSLALPSRTFVQSAATGALMGATEQRGKDESLLKNIATGGGGGALGSALVSTAGRVLKPVRTVAPEALSKLAEKAKNYGLTLSPGQITGSQPIKWLESVMADLPMTAGKQMAFNQMQHRQYNKALLSTMGETADNFGEDVMAHAKKRIGGGIGDVAERNTLQSDYPFLFGIADHKRVANEEYPEIAPVINKYVDTLMGRIRPDGTISGKAYRTFDTQIGERIKSTSDGDLRFMLGKIRAETRDAMDRSISLGDKQEWKKLRRQYANMKKLEPLAAKSTTGDISPALVTAAAIKKSPDAAYRTSDLKDLGKIGKEFLKPMPSSGTAQRNFYMKMLTSPINTGNILGGGAGYLAGGPSGAALGGLLSTALTSGSAAIPLQALMHSNAGRKYLTEGVLQGLNAYSPQIHRISAPLGAYGLLQNNKK